MTVVQVAFFDSNGDACIAEITEDGRVAVYGKGQVSPGPTDIIGALAFVISQGIKLDALYISAEDDAQARRLAGELGIDLKSPSFEVKKLVVPN